jgi:5-(carboxyamino)imidazole ribonucleotide mutase
VSAEALVNGSAPVIGVVMGSDSDWSVMQAASTTLTEFGVPHEVRVVSAHRTPEAMIALRPRERAAPPTSRGCSRP